MIYILDTDMLTLFQHNHPVVIQRVLANSDRISVTIVTAEEQIRGRLNIIRRASQFSQPEQLILAYLNLRKTLDFFGSIKWVNFGEQANNIYREVLSQKIRIGSQDLKIAAIVLANKSILITRNSRDFIKVPGLVFEDWSRVV